MNIGGYGVANYHGSYGFLHNKAKTSAAGSAIPAEKPKAETKNNNTANNCDQFKVKGYDPFKDLAKTGSISFPSWIYTKTEPTRSDEEILKDVVELAKKHAEQGTFQNWDYEFHSLIEEWVSPVSPDREAILNRTVNEINDNIKISNSHKGKVERKNSDPIGMLLQVFENMQSGENKKISNSNKTTGSSSGSGSSSSNGYGQIIYNMSGATYDACVENGEVKAAIIRDSSGDAVMYFDGTSGQLSVTESGTEKEGLRRYELLKVYNETYKNTTNSKGIVSGNSFDAVG